MAKRFRGFERTSCKNKSADAREGLFANLHIVPKACEPDHVSLAAEPCDLALGVLSRVALSVEDGLPRIQLAADQLAWRVIRTRARRMIALAMTDGSTWYSPFDKR